VRTIRNTNNIQRFSPYLTGNTLYLRYKAQPVNAVKETVAVYCENHTKPINILVFYVKVSGSEGQQEPEDEYTLNNSTGHSTLRSSDALPMCCHKRAGQHRYPVCASSKLFKYKTYLDP
jgi:hypothetical protein